MSGMKAKDSCRHQQVSWIRLLLRLVAFTRQSNKIDPASPIFSPIKGGAQPLEIIALTVFFNACCSAAFALACLLQALVSSPPSYQLSPPLILYSTLSPSKKTVSFKQQAPAKKKLL